MASCSSNSSSSNNKITTIIFDVDDTLYDVGTGFTAHRNGEGAQSFMVEKLGFPSLQAAKQVRDEYFERYHSTAKALTVAEAEGRFPPITTTTDEDDDLLLGSTTTTTTSSSKQRFHTQDLAEWWAQNLDFSLLGGPNPKLVKAIAALRPLTLVAFSNGPRKYVKRVLVELGLFEYFGEERLFAVDDVLPHCKPEPEAFQVIFEKLKIRPEECVMVEDSMKNIRMAKKLGLKTVLVTGRRRRTQAVVGQEESTDDETAARNSKADEAEATKAGDAPIEDDPAVDVAIESCDELRDVLPGLWETPATFSPRYYRN